VNTVVKLILADDPGGERPAKKIAATPTRGGAPPPRAVEGPPEIPARAPERPLRVRAIARNHNEEETRLLATRGR